MFEVGQVVRCRIDNRVAMITEVIRPYVFRLSFDPTVDAITGTGTVRKAKDLELCESGLFNIAYDTAEGTKHYCAMNCDYEMAMHTLINFRKRYFNTDGSSKPYPNGKGFYDIANVRIVEV